MNLSKTLLDYTIYFIWFGLIGVGILVYLIYKEFNKKSDG